MINKIIKIKKHSWTFWIWMGKYCEKTNNNILTFLKDN